MKAPPLSVKNYTGIFSFLYVHIKGVAYRLLLSQNRVYWVTDMVCKNSAAYIAPVSF